MGLNGYPLNNGFDIKTSQEANLGQLKFAL